MKKNKRIIPGIFIFLFIFFGNFIGPCGEIALKSLNLYTLNKIKCYPVGSVSFVMAFDMAAGSLRSITNDEFPNDESMSNDECLK